MSPYKFIPGESEKPKLGIPTKSPRPVGCWAFPNLSFKAWKLENATRKTPKSQLPSGPRKMWNSWNRKKKMAPKMVGGLKIPKVNKRSPKNLTFMIFGGVQNPVHLLLSFVGHSLFLGLHGIKTSGKFSWIHSLSQRHCDSGPTNLQSVLALAFSFGIVQRLD